MRPIVLTTVLFLAGAIPASASIAIFTDGRNMKIDSYRMLDDESMTLVMKGGGSMTLPITRIDRIIDDEITTPEVVEEVKKIVEEGGVFPRRSWHYNEMSGPIFKSKFDKIIIDAAKR